MRESANWAQVAWNKLSNTKKMTQLKNIIFYQTLVLAQAINQLQAWAALNS